MDKEKLEIAIKEMYKLYDCGKFKELNNIMCSEKESEERRAAAYTMLEMGPDPRRLI